ncbi:MAG: dTDP-4-dehydrorhamnose reductase [Candidatus Krumholzibacteria bacterium]|nr:dTDP-4-dehydrorhamnose reductase [Candidatus Krumholzibacteria bacterium]
MTIAIIGADGQLGKDVQLALKAHDTRPIAHGEVDITDAAKVVAAIAAIHPDWVINTAAMTHVDDCEGQHMRAFEINALGARHVAEASRQVGAALIHISTDYVFDGEKKTPYMEGDATHPLNVYGISKLAGEFYVRNTCPVYYIIRTSGLYGTHKCRGKGQNFVETMLKLAKEKESLRIVSDEVLTPTFTEDLARQIDVLVESKPPHGIYHATNDGACSWFDFAKEIFRIAAIEVAVEETTASQWNAPARRPAYSVLENKALKRAGIDAMSHWKDALGRYLSKKIGR